ncbi:hypothetical protein F4805DRAFT_442192 [Annulohypoxylon moriforme]|nr:hypothetical protein F4805DRAFT_442192 [Annulohypoxylon moriforme]
METGLEHFSFTLCLCLGYTITRTQTTQLTREPLFLNLIHRTPDQSIRPTRNICPIQWHTLPDHRPERYRLTFTARFRPSSECKIFRPRVVGHARRPRARDREVLARAPTIYERVDGAGSSVAVGVGGEEFRVED